MFGCIGFGRIGFGILASVLLAAPVWAEAPPGAEETENGTIIWKAQRNGDAKAAPPQSAGVPDRNGIIWNDPPGSTAVKAAPETPQAVEGQAGPCREYDTEITIEGRRQAMRGTACREADGRWRVISQVPR